MTPTTKAVNGRIPLRPKETRAFLPLLNFQAIRHFKVWQKTKLKFTALCEGILD